MSWKTITPWIAITPPKQKKNGKKYYQVCSNIKIRGKGPQLYVFPDKRNQFFVIKFINQVVTIFNQFIVLDFHIWYLTLNCIEDYSKFLNSNYTHE